MVSIFSFSVFRVNFQTLPDKKFYSKDIKSRYTDFGTLKPDVAKVISKSWVLAKVSYCFTE